jgi:DNA-binding SARP family transcriptional activator
MNGADQAPGAVGERRWDSAGTLVREALALWRGELLADLPMSLAASNPLREQLWELCALALYRGGRQAKVLRVCAQLRRALRDELGLDPGPAIADLETAMLRHDQSLELVPPTRALVSTSTRQGTTNQSRTGNLS